MPAIQRFENYEVLHRDDGSVFELGRGAMGVTYKARDTDLHCDVALKVINPGILGSPDARERFMREARAAAQLRHPNIASVFRLGKSADDTHFYAMEFCEGPTLEQAVAKRGPLPTLEALRIALQVSDALMLAEDHRLLHRDLKPANLILTARRSEGTVVKVIDFGLAKSFADGSQTLASHGTGGFVGTAHFASPEQLEEHDLDIRSDIYSLGVCLWFMLDGRPLFAGSLARVMSQTLSSDPPWERLAAQPPVVLDLLRRMLAKNPDDRPATAAELRGEIEECIRAMGSAVPGSEFSRGPAVANRALEEWEFAIRYPMSEEVGRDALGRIFRAADENHGGATVAVRIIDAALIAVPATRRELEAQIATARAHPHGHLIALLDHAFSSHGLCVATEWLEGFSLIELLKQRGALAPSEVVQLLAPLAAAADHAASHGIRGLNFAKEQIVIHFPAALDAAGRTRVLGTPLDEWPRHLVKVGTLSLGDSGPIGEGTLASMATMAPAAGTRGVALPAVSSVAHIACELLGGRGGEAFAPLPRLSEAGNAVLRRAFTETRAFPNATAFIEALRATVGNPPATSAPRTTTIPPAQVPLPPSRWKAIAAATLIVLTLAGATVGYFYGIHQPREREREKRAAEAEATGTDFAEKQRLTTAKSEPAATLARYSGIWSGRIDHVSADYGTANSRNIVIRIPAGSKMAAVSTDDLSPSDMPVKLMGGGIELYDSFETNRDVTGYTRITMTMRSSGNTCDIVMRTEFGDASWTELAGVVSATKELAGKQLVAADEAALIKAEAENAKADAEMVQAKLAATQPPLSQALSKRSISPQTKVDSLGAGRILVNTVPPRATVYLDGRDKGSSPMALDDVAIGLRRLKVMVDGYEPVELMVEVTGAHTSDPGTIHLVARKPLAPLAPAPSNQLNDEAVRELVRRVLFSTEKGDLNTLANCYTSPVNYSDEGALSSSKLRLSLEDYRRHWPLIDIADLGAISVNSTSDPDTKTASYSYTFVARDPQHRKLSRGVAHDSITVRNVSGRPLITHFRQTVTNRQKNF